MPLINHTYSSLSQGVSEQAVEARHESQVEEMVNCIPHISRGVLRRNPLEFLAVLKDKDNIPLTLSDYYMYSYDRGTSGEQYIVLVGHYRWYVFTVDGVLKGSYDDTVNSGTTLSYLNTNGKHPKEVFSMVTVGDHTWLSNNQITTAMTTQDDGLDINFHRTVAIHTIKSTGNIVTKTTTSAEGTIATPTLKGYRYSLKAHYNTIYPHTSDYADIESNEDITSGRELAKAMRDQLNTGHVASAVAASTEGPYYKASYSSATQTFRASTAAYVKTVNGSPLWHFYYNRHFIGTSGTSTLVIAPYTYKAYLFPFRYVNIAEGLFAYGITREVPSIAEDNPLAGLWSYYGPTIFRRSLPNGTTLEYTDSNGNTASYGFNGLVPSSDKLPATVPKSVGDVLVKIDASEDVDSGEYWLKWNGSSWLESRGAGLFNIIDHNTMPHTFLRAEDGKFSFGYYGKFNGSVEDSEHIQLNSPKWDDRLVGDVDSAPTPSFIGKKVDDIFVHNNRLGLLAEDTIVLSELSKYSNFFPTTIRTIPATDPIDIIIATTDVQGLRKAISLSGTLLLFSNDSQFILSGGGGPLTPETATVNSVSNYNYSSEAPATIVGNKVLFTTESGNGTQVFNMSAESITSGSYNIVADNTSLHIPTYLPKDINYMVSHSILGYLFMLSPSDPKSIYVLNTLEVNKQVAQTAFHKWVFDYHILGLAIVDNNLIMLMSRDSNNLSITKISLDIPSETNTVNYLDTFDGVDLTYESSLVLSKWFAKDQNGFGNRRGRLQIRTALFSTNYYDTFKVELLNDSLFLPKNTEENWVLSDGVWDDTAYWGFNMSNNDDSIIHWSDTLPHYSRVYYNDTKITVMSNSATTFIKFSNSDLEPSKGFTLSTVNLEGLLTQRSQRI